jgi:hypothetical protein
MAETGRRKTMTMADILKEISDMKKRYSFTHSKRTEEEVDGEIKFVDFHIRYKVDKEKKRLDIQKKQS